jgi:hypothetical protein
MSVGGALRAVGYQVVREVQTLNEIWCNAYCPGFVGRKIFRDRAVKRFAANVIIQVTISRLWAVWR